MWLVFPLSSESWDLVPGGPWGRMVRRRSRVRNCPLPMGKVPLARDRRATGPGTEWLLTWLFPRVSGWGHRSLESSWPQIALLIKKQRIQKFYKGFILSLTALLDFEHEYVHAHKHIYPGLYNLKVYYSYEAICSILNPCFSSNQLKPLPPTSWRKCFHAYFNFVVSLPLLGFSTGYCSCFSFLKM